MRIIFVRHGEPDYINDCITERGILQAKACAERLKDEGITEIYSSPCGRAKDTAQYTADMLGLKVNILDYMREIRWGGEGIPDEGHVWTLGDKLLYEENFDFSKDDWKEHPYFKNNIALSCYEHVTNGIDGFLESQGYIHEGRRFKCVGGSDKTIALFSHGGSGGCALSHLLSIPFPYFCAVFPYDFTSITTLDFPVVKEGYVHNRVEVFNDCLHIKGISEGLKLQQTSEN
jgi:probable phosphoglycerate mutase